MKEKITTTGRRRLLRLDIIVSCKSDKEGETFIQREKININI